MAKKRRTKQIHYPPGSLVYKGREQSQKATARIVRYNAENFTEQSYAGDPDAIKPIPEHVTWIHVNGIHDVELIGTIGNTFQFHPLLLEDILSTETIPKHEDFENCIFASLNLITLAEEGENVTISNVSLVLMKDVILSFQESGEDYNNQLYDRLKNNQGQLRLRHADYLFYRNIDIIVDEYKDILDQVEDHTEEIEDKSIRDPDQTFVSEIQQLRWKLNRMRRNVTPLQKLVNGLYLEPGSYFRQNTMHFLRDLLDDLEHVHQRIETEKENLLNIMDINFTNLSTKTNEVMRVLTIVATIFIPTTFLAGIYGMNFKFMPELEWKYSYPLFWTIMLIIIISMLWFFRRRKWL